MSRHDNYPEGQGKARRKADARLKARRTRYDSETDDEKRAQTRPGSMKARRN